MKRFYISTTEFNNRQIEGEEFNHIKNVMRMKIGDRFIAFFGDEYDYICEITNITKNFLTYNILDKELNRANPNISISLFQALAKGEKLELVAQKTTEIGISEFYPLYTKNCDVKPTTTRTSRLEKIVISACKQCGRSKLPKLYDVVNLNECINILKSFDLVLFANESETNLRLYDCLNKFLNAKKIAIIIGPEGGFTSEEIELLKPISNSVTLGNRILRTETASIYLTSIISDFYRN